MILFIEDEPKFNESYVEALEFQGYTVKVIWNVQIALNTLRHMINDIQLVILDIIMPIYGEVPPEFNTDNIKQGLRTGEEILRVMSDIPGGENIPKIILTNVNSYDFHHKYMLSNLVHGCYRKKDVLPSDLVNIINKILTTEG